MTEEMESNLINANNIQYFEEVKYYCVPPNNKHYRLFVLMSFNKAKFKITLWNLSLISNEDFETFYTILEYLKNKYKFNPKNITLDFSKAEYNAFKIIFRDITIIPCFYHYCQNFARKLPELRNKNKVLKKIAKDLFSNLKLLCFVERNNLLPFYNEIKYKFSSKFPNFFNYFQKFLFWKQTIQWNVMEL